MNGNNYNSWSKSMKHALLVKNKLKFINDKIVALAADASLILEIAQCTIYFSKEDHLCMLDLFQEIHSIHQGERKYVIRFLKELGDQFNIVKTQILMTKPLSSINKVFSLVLQQERQVESSLLSEPPKILMSNSNVNQGRGNSQWNCGRGRMYNQSRGFNNNTAMKVCTFSFAKRLGTQWRLVTLSTTSPWL
ncbi:hypothetical protein CR513_56889, partial [Mucuna pruriens]